MDFFSLRLRAKTAPGSEFWEVETWQESLQLEKQAWGLDCGSVKIDAEVSAAEPP